MIKHKIDYETTTRIQQAVTPSNKKDDYQNCNI